METALQPIEGRLAPAPLPVLVSSLWRDPHTVPPEQLQTLIERLKLACEEHPGSADLRTCLGMAYAMNHEAYLSMDALEEARNLDPANFWAQYKFAELQYRLRALEVAENEMKQALELATNGMELALARKLLQEIRRLRREGTQKPSWSKPLRWPAIFLACATVASALIAALR